MDHLGFRVHHGRPSSPVASEDVRQRLDQLHDAH